MKYIGFIKEHDKISESVSYNEILASRDNDKDIIKKIIDYLDNGEIIFGWMGYYNDLDNNTPIEPHSYHTDGIWVWPSYFSYYLKKYLNYNLSEEFLNYLIDKSFSYKNGIPFDKSKIEQELIDKLGAVID
jgi:hypothetical protein